MKSKIRVGRLRRALISVNLIAIPYPIANLISANSGHSRFVAEMALVGVVFVLAMLDSLGIVIATS